MTALADQIAGLSPERRRLLEALIARENRPELARALPIPAGQDPVVSFAQARMWLLSQLAPASPALNLAAATRLDGPLDPAALHQALDGVLARHATLRTALIARDGQPMPSVVAASLALRQVDLRGLPPDERQRRARDLAQAVAEEPFDLARPPLLRAALLRLDDAVHDLILAVHHSAADGWSLGVLAREIGAIYAAALAGHRPDLPDLPITYADYAAWQRRQITGQLAEGQLAYWRDQLAGAPALLALPTDRPRPVAPQQRGARVPVRIPPALWAAVGALSQQRGLTPFTVVAAALVAILGRYSGQDEICLGTPVAGRGRRETEDLVGLFVNTVVLRTSLAGDPSFDALLEQVAAVTRAAVDHQDLPFERVVETLRPARVPAVTPLFQVMLTYQPAPTLALPGLAACPIAIERTSALFDLTLALTEDAAGCGGFLEYDRDLFDQATIVRLCDHWLTLLAAGVGDPAGAVSAIDLLAGHERRQILGEWRTGAGLDLPLDAPHAVVAAHARRQPDALAVAAADHTLTYGALDAWARDIARLLGRAGLPPEGVVAIDLDRSARLIAALLGVWKAGGAVLLLDRAHPRERLAAILGDAPVALVLTTSDRVAALPGGIPICCLDGEAVAAPGSTSADASAEAEPIRLAPTRLAYLIATSGTTGRPKLVQIEQRSLTNTALAQAAAFGVTAASRVLQFAALSFDAALSEITLALLSGASLHIWPRQVVFAPEALLDFLERAAISVVLLTPSVLTLLSPRPLPDVRTVVVAGEACPAGLAERWAAGRRLLNAYGPAEAAICAAIMPYAGAARASVPIGRPLAGAALYVLDHRLQTVPIGVAGELAIGGLGVGRGYVGRPDLTAERFVPDPFGSAGARLYRTGDLARWLPDGTLEFLGRADRQVKLNGMRVELEEIQAILGHHPAVAEVAVVLAALGAEGRTLAAYVAPRSGPAAPTLAADLRQWAAAALPPGLVPAVVVLAGGLPLTPHGKIDYRDLASRPLVAAAPAADPGPERPYEGLIAGIWQAALDGAPIDRRLSFFDHGGHSLLLAAVHSQLEQALGRPIPITALFEHPTIPDLATYLTAGADVPDTGPADPDRAARQRAARQRRALAENQRGSA